MSSENEKKISGNERVPTIMAKRIAAMLDEVGVYFGADRSTTIRRLIVEEHRRLFASRAGPAQAGGKILTEVEGPEYPDSLPLVADREVPENKDARKRTRQKK